MASLEGDDGHCYELTGTVVTVGRDPVNDIVLSRDPKVSRTQAELRERDGQWIVVDLGSRNGTVVNGRRVSSHPLRSGDRILVGASSLVFTAAADTNATEVATEIEAGPNLTARERKVLEAVADGLTDKAIAAELSISVSTVRSHLDRIREKTGLRRRSELTRLAINLRIGG